MPARSIPWHRSLHRLGESGNPRPFPMPMDAEKTYRFTPRLGRKPDSDECRRRGDRHLR